MLNPQCSGSVQHSMKTLTTLRKHKVDLEETDRAQIYVLQGMFVPHCFVPLLHQNQN